MARRPKPFSQTYTAELKLAAVPAYVRDPKRKQQICQEKGISELLLEQWHQEFLQRAGQVFPSSELPAAAKRSKRKRRTRNPVEDQGTDDSSPWGVRLNSERAYYRSPSTSAHPPHSLRGEHPGEWDERGLFIWDRSVQKMERFPAGRALEILEELRTHQAWRTEGLRIIQPWLVYDHPADETEDVTPKPRQVQEELFHLTTAASGELAEFLQEREVFLKEMAVEDVRDWEKRQEQAFSILFQARRRAEADDAVLDSRALPWTRHLEPVALVCDDPPNRGTVTLTKDGWVWQACIERPKKVKQWNRPLMWIGDALNWTEQELIAARTQTGIRSADSLRASGSDGVGPSPMVDLAHYRIDPSDLEPERVTNRAIIEVEHVPTELETVELSFGETMRRNERYPTPSQLARELNMDSFEVRIEQPCSAYGSYEIFPIATFDQREAAAARAQDLWNRCTMAEMFATGKVQRARFRFGELETGFRTWLGSLESSENPWAKAESRVEYLADLARRETPVHALDVKGFREHAHVSPTALPNQKLLVLLHQWRATSKYIPEHARQESQIWLAQHNKSLI